MATALISTVIVLKFYFAIIRVKLKKYLLKSSIGHVALVGRDKLSLFKAAFSMPERVGTRANDILASTIITRICQSEKTFVDVGSHIGSVIFEVNRNDNNIGIVGIEAIPEKVVALRKNFTFAEIFDCAVGEESKTVRFFVNDKKSGFSSLKKPAIGDSNYVREITVSMKTLDEIMQSYEVDAIKIDVEGFELGVIKGGQRIIAKCKPIVLFESSFHQDEGLGELWQLFETLEYKIHLPNRLAHNDQGLSLESFIDSHVYPRHTNNYFAVPVSRRIEFRDRARRILGLN